MAATFSQLASGAGAVPATAVAASAFAALRATGSVHVPDIVERLLKTVQREGPCTEPHARALACMLCSACASARAVHAHSPADAEDWLSVEESIEAWFSSQEQDNVDALLMRIVSRHERRVEEDAAEEQAPDDEFAVFDDLDSHEIDAI